MMRMSMILLSLSVPAAATVQVRIPSPGTSGKFPGSREMPGRAPLTPLVTLKLSDIPESWVTLDPDAKRFATRRSPAPAPGAIGPGAGGAIYVQRTGSVTAGSKCPYNFHDTITLRTVRQAGYKIVQAWVEELPAPNGFTLRRDGYNVHTINRGARADNPPVKLEDAVEIGVTAGVTDLVGPRIVQGVPVLCWSGYRLHLKVRGPRDMNPLTGARAAANVVH